MVQTFLFQYGYIFGYFGLFIFGLFIGSFLNVVSDRVSTGTSPVKGRSKCDACDKPLGPKDLVPLFSYMFLKGKCRYCSNKLSWYYPFSEILTGLAFVGIGYYLGVFSAGALDIWFSYAYMAISASFLIIILLADMKYRLIPNKVVFPAIAFVLFMTLLAFGVLAFTSYQAMQADPFGKYLISVGYWRDQMIMIAQNVGITLISAIGIGLFFWLLIFITKGKGMGGGDLNLAFLIGLLNGFPGNIVAIALAFTTGALFSLGMIVLRKKTLKDTIPFGPFLILGSVLAFGFGQVIFDLYTRLM